MSFNIHKEYLMACDRYSSENCWGGTTGVLTVLADDIRWGKVTPRSARKIFKRYGWHYDPKSKIWMCENCYRESQGRTDDDTQQLWFAEEIDGGVNITGLLNKS